MNKTSFLSEFPGRTEYSRQFLERYSESHIGSLPQGAVHGFHWFKNHKWLSYAEIRSFQDGFFSCSAMINCTSWQRDSKLSSAKLFLCCRIGFLWLSRTNFMQLLCGVPVDRPAGLLIPERRSPIPNISNLDARYFMSGFWFFDE